MDYRVGDIFTCTEPTHPDCRFRIRDIEKLDHWDGPQYAMQLYTLFNIKNGDFCWHNRGHDRHMTNDQIKKNGLTRIKRGKPVWVQMEMF